MALLFEVFRCTLVFLFLRHNPLISICLLYSNKIQKGNQLGGNFYRYSNRISQAQYTIDMKKLTSLQHWDGKVHPNTCDKFAQHFFSITSWIRRPLSIHVYTPPVWQVFISILVILSRLWELSKWQVAYQVRPSWLHDSSL